MFKTTKPMCKLLDGDKTALKNPIVPAVTMIYRTEGMGNFPAANNKTIFNEYDEYNININFDMITNLLVNTVEKRLDFSKLLQRTQIEKEIEKAGLTDKKLFYNIAAQLEKLGENRSENQKEKTVSLLAEIRILREAEEKNQKLDFFKADSRTLKQGERLQFGEASKRAEKGNNGAQLGKAAKEFAQLDMNKAAHGVKSIEQANPAKMKEQISELAGALPTKNEEAQLSHLKNSIAREAEIFENKNFEAGDSGNISAAFSLYEKTVSTHQQLFEELRSYLKLKLASSAMHPVVKEELHGDIKKRQADNLPTASDIEKTEENPRDMQSTFKLSEKSEISEKLEYVDITEKAGNNKIPKNDRSLEKSVNIEKELSRKAEEKSELHTAIHGEIKENREIYTAAYEGAKERQAFPTKIQNAAIEGEESLDIQNIGEIEQRKKIVNRGDKISKNPQKLPIDKGYFESPMLSPADTDYIIEADKEITQLPNSEAKGAIKQPLDNAPVLPHAPMEKWQNSAKLENSEENNFIGNKISIQENTVVTQLYKTVTENGRKGGAVIKSPIMPINSSEEINSAVILDGELLPIEIEYKPQSEDGDHKATGNMGKNLTVENKKTIEIKEIIEAEKAIEAKKIIENISKSHENNGVKLQQEKMDALKLPVQPRGENPLSAEPTMRTANRHNPNLPAKAAIPLEALSRMFSHEENIEAQRESEKTQKNQEQLQYGMNQNVTEQANLLENYIRIAEMQKRELQKEEQITASQEKKYIETAKESSTSGEKEKFNPTNQGEVQDKISKRGDLSKIPPQHVQNAKNYQNAENAPTNENNLNSQDIQNIQNPMAKIEYLENYEMPKEPQVDTNYLVEAVGTDNLRNMDAETIGFIKKLIAGGAVTLSAKEDKIPTNRHASQAEDEKSKKEIVNTEKGDKYQKQILQNNVTEKEIINSRNAFEEDGDREPLKLSYAEEMHGQPQASQGANAFDGGISGSAHTITTNKIIEEQSQGKETIAYIINQKQKLIMQNQKITNTITKLSEKQEIQFKASENNGNIFTGAELGYLNSGRESDGAIIPKNLRVQNSHFSRANVRQNMESHESLKLSQGERAKLGQELKGELAGTVTELLEKSMAGSIERITDKVYRNLEDRLRSERTRRGAL